MVEVVLWKRRVTKIKGLAGFCNDFPHAENEQRQLRVNYQGNKSEAGGSAKTPVKMVFFSPFPQAAWKLLEVPHRCTQMWNMGSSPWYTQQISFNSDVNRRDQPGADFNPRQRPAEPKVTNLERFTPLENPEIWQDHGKCYEVSIYRRYRREGPKPWSRTKIQVTNRKQNKIRRGSITLKLCFYTSYWTLNWFFFYLSKSTLRC